MTYQVKEVQNISDVCEESWDSIKNNVYIRLINKKYANEKYSDLILVNFLDLVLAFYVRNNNKIHLLTTNDIQKYNISLKELRKYSFQNSFNEKNVRLETVIDKMTNNNLVMNLIAGSSDTKTEVNNMTFPTSPSKIPVLFLSSSRILYGSSLIVSQKVVEEICMAFDYDSFYIVPITVNELMCIKKTYLESTKRYEGENVEKRMLRLLEMSNDSCDKDAKDILSYSIYLYDNEDKAYMAIKQ